MSRHGWLTPNSIPSVTVGRCIQIPDNPEIIAAVTGALFPLTKAYNWEKFGLIEPDEIAYAMLLMLDSYFNSECDAMNCADVISCMFESGLFYDTTGKEYRVVDGVPQWSWDGVTWSDILGDSNAQPTAPTLQPTEGADEWDKACLAATRAANVFDELHKQTWGAMQAGFAGAIATFFNVVSETIATLIGLHYGEAGGLVASEILRLGTSDPNRFVSSGLTSQAREDFICLLMDNFSVNSGVVTFNFGAVVDNVVTAVSGGDGLDLYLLLQYVKATGLNAAGQVNSTDTANCNACIGCAEDCETVTTLWDNLQYKLQWSGYDSDTTQWEGSIHVGKPSTFTIPTGHECVTAVRIRHYGSVGNLTVTVGGQAVTIASTGTGWNDRTFNFDGAMVDTIYLNWTGSGWLVPDWIRITHCV